ncbi:MAG: hypothetical protein ABFR62_12685 [Bacteroidota bacterium]
MKYSTLFKERLESNGLPPLNIEQFQRYVKIVDLERDIYELKGEFSSTEKFNKPQHVIIRLHSSLTELTENKDPIILFEEMLSLSG